MKYLQLFVFILSLVACDNNKVKYHCQVIENSKFEMFPAMMLVAEEFVLDDSTLLEPFRLWIQDSLLVVFDYPVGDNRFLKYYSLNSGKLLRSFGTIGRGPNEYLTPEVHWDTDNTFLLTEKLRYSVLNNDSLLHSTTYQPIKQNVQAGIIAASAVYLLNDSLMLIHSNMSDEQFSINNRITGEYITKYTNYPCFVSDARMNDFISNSNVYFAYYLLRPRSKDSLAIVYKRFPVVDIVALKDFSTKRIQFPIDKDVNHVQVMDKLNARIDNKVIYYTSFYSTENYFYLLYNPIPTMRDPKYVKSFEIQQFNWQGDLMMRYKMDRSIREFCVDEKEQKIYATSVGNDEDFSVKIWTYDMKKNLR